MDTFDFKHHQKIFATRFSAVISSNGMTPKDFSVETGIPDATVYRYLNCDRVPKIDNIIKIALYFGVSIDWLIGLTEDAHEHLSPKALTIGTLYMSASASDRRVIDTVLDKYSEVAE